MLDTHTHIQFKVFDDILNEVIAEAKKAGIEKIIAVGTDLETSEKAIEIAQQYPEVFASVGIHPHHVFEFLKEPSAISRQLSSLEELLKNPKVVAIGETGMDKHVYKKTKYSNYLISKEFLELQRIFFEKQIQLALKHNKSLIIHNRQAVAEILEVLEKNWDKKLEKRSVFHFCESDERLLEFAIKHNIFIGVNADVLTDLERQEFVKKIPLENLVLETDSPFISLTPAGILEILEFLSGLLKTNAKRLQEIVYNNSLRLFNLQ